MFHFFPFFHIFEPRKMNQMEKTGFYLFSELKIGKNLWRWNRLASLIYIYYFHVYTFDTRRVPQIPDFFHLFPLNSINWNNLNRIPDFFELFQPTANCFISSICSTVFRPRKWNNWRWGQYMQISIPLRQKYIFNRLLKLLYCSGHQYLDTYKRKKILSE